MRKPVMAGNWKMNKTRDEALQFIYTINQSLPTSTEVESIIFAPEIFLRCLVKRQGNELKIGAQNIHYADSGEFTGELSPVMAKTTGVTHVLIGHNERRKYANETDESVNLKVQAAFKHDLIPVLCCGETEFEYDNNTTEESLKRQITIALNGVQKSNVENLIIAYEPVWAIGTGKRATSEVANNEAKFIRSIVASLYDVQTSEKVRILYGGSVSTDTVTGYISQSDIDGCLVGKASLDPASFIQLVKACL